MKLTRIAPCDFADLKNTTADAIIVASGYESRARAVATDINSMKIAPRIRCAWGFMQHQDNKIRRQNDKTLEKLGYHISVISGNDGESTESWIHSLLTKNVAEPLTFIVDISSMTRNWYGGIVKAVANSRRQGGLRILFAYTPAQWIDIQEPPPNEVLGPVAGFASHSLPNLPTALIMGLGKDQDRAIGLSDILDSEITIGFIPSRGDKKYDAVVFKANEDLLNSLSDEALYRYNIFDTFGTFKMLESVCQGLSRSCRVVLASLGPKLFGLYCFLIAANNDEVSVWRVSAATRQEPYDLKPDSQRIVFDTEWE